MSKPHTENPIDVGSPWGEQMTAASIRWQIAGDYFENCNCDVVCPCVFSSQPFLTAKPTNGFCEVAFAFHVDQGTYGDVALHGLNVVVMARAPGTMADGNWSVAVYLDDRADSQQSDALQKIFTGSAGGPLGGLAPLISTVLGIRSAPIIYEKLGKRRTVRIPNLMDMGVHAAPGLDLDKEILATNAHPFAPDGVAMAVGDEGSTWADYGMSWDNSGKNGHYAAIRWSNQ
jgi:hypothetical protein